MIKNWWKSGVPSAGLFAGPAAWAISTELNYALAGWICASGMQWVTPALAALLTALGIFGALLSWRAWTNLDAVPTADGTIPAPRRLLAGIGVLSGVLFALVIATQGTAGFILQGCER